ncbi:hypothetical protein Tdes44962_MAKER04806 [Teratosphaeria destructans]|uniref:Uncharacterized protein n=1 Tax=Teratosphaeria destructans TaxID=418781 RepID=A0A9W7SLE7_9PEZI|nr:hypothetical protein Tdes44962_MAKER04806 [Teratosphaeria destructans]
MIVFCGICTPPWLMLPTSPSRFVYLNLSPSEVGCLCTPITSEVSRPVPFSTKNTAFSVSQKSLSHSPVTWCAASPSPLTFLLGLGRARRGERRVGTEGVKVRRAGGPQTHHRAPPAPEVVEKWKPVSAIVAASTAYADAWVLERRALSVEDLREAGAVVVVVVVAA